VIVKVKFLWMWNWLLYQNFQCEKNADCIYYCEKGAVRSSIIGNLWDWVLVSTVWGSKCFIDVWEFGLVALRSGNAFRPTNEVTLCHAGLVLDGRRAGKPSRYVTSHLGQLSLLSLQGRQIKYRPICLGLRQGTFTCVGWQVTLCDPIWQVTLRSCEMGFP